MQLQDSKKFRMKLGMKFSVFFFFLNKMSLIRPHILGTGIFVPLEPGGERRLCCSHESVAVLSNYYNNKYILKDCPGKGMGEWKGYIIIHNIIIQTLNISQNPTCFLIQHQNSVQNPEQGNINLTKRIFLELFFDRPDVLIIYLIFLFLNRFSLFSIQYSIFCKDECCTIVSNLA